MLCDRHSMGYGVDHSGRVKGSEPCQTPRPPSRLASCRESSTRLHDRGISRPALLRFSFVPACTDYGRAWQPVLSPAFAVFHPMLASVHARTHARARARTHAHPSRACAHSCCFVSHASFDLSRMGSGTKRRHRDQLTVPTRHQEAQERERRRRRRQPTCAHARHEDVGLEVVDGQ